MVKRKEFILGAAFGLTLAAGATAGGIIDWPQAQAQVAGASGRLTPGAEGRVFTPPPGAPLSFADIIQQVSPAVVQIDVTSRAEQPATLTIPGLPFAIPNPNSGQQGGDTPTREGAGSGFFVSAEGFIVTNNHVVEDATEINVTLADGRELDARLIGRDEETDLAVIKVEGADFPFVSFEEDANPRVGDWVIAVGNPLRLGGTATAGIVSGLSRQNIDPNTSGFVDFLQIDAAINQGNSGGPTFDVYGRVIGVNSAIFSPTGGSIGIGFAIPANVASSVTQQLIDDGAVQRGYVGLSLQTFNADQWEGLGEPRDTAGAYVAEVTPGAPADRGGAQVGDILVAVNGQAVANGTEATRRVGAARPGEAIRLDVVRNGRRQALSVRSGTRPSLEELDRLQQQPTGDAAGAPSADSETVEGISVTNLTPALRRRLNLPDAINGVAITGVAPGTPGAQARLTAGIVITQVGRTSVTTVADMQAAVAAARARRQPAVLLFIRTPQGRGSVLLRFSADG